MIKRATVTERIGTQNWTPAPVSLIALIRERKLSAVAYMIAVEAIERFNPREGPTVRLSCRELSRKFGFDRETVSNALRDLCAQGLLDGRATRGYSFAVKVDALVRETLRLSGGAQSNLPLLTSMGGGGVSQPGGGGVSQPGVAGSQARDSGTQMENQSEIPPTPRGVGGVSASPLPATASAALSDEYRGQLDFLWSKKDKLLDRDAAVVRRLRESPAPDVAEVRRCIAAGFVKFRKEMLDVRRFYAMDKQRRTA